MRRFGFSGGVALFIIVFAAAPSWACVDPEVGVSQQAVHPGDPVYWNVINLGVGAEFTVQVGSQTMVHRTATGNSESGSFPMPDFGPSGTNVSVEVIARHSDIENADQTLKVAAAQPIRYAGAASPSSGETQTPSQDPAPSSAPASSVESAPQHTDAGAPSPPAAPPAAGHRTAAPRPSGGGSPRAVNQPRRAVRAKPHPSVQTPQLTTANRESIALPALVPYPLARARPEARRVARGRVHRTVAQSVIARASPDAAVGWREAEPADAKSGASGDAALLGLAVVSAVLAFMLRRRGFGLLVRRGSPRSIPPIDGVTDDLAVEAELQEIIAEERARATARSGGPGPPG